MSTTSDVPYDVGQLTTSAVALHEMYLAYVAAGFTEAQALYLVGQILAAAQGAK